MKTTNGLILRLSLGLACVALGAGCGKDSTAKVDDTQKQGKANETTKQQPAAVQEAIKLAVKCAGEHWIIQENGDLWWGYVEHDGMGTSFFGYNSCDVQFKPVVPHLAVEEVSEADKLNGIEWKGAVNFSATAFRFQQRDKSWTEWRTWKHGTFWSVSLERRSGKWTADEHVIELARSGNPNEIYFVWKSLKSSKPKGAGGAGPP